MPAPLPGVPTQDDDYLHVLETPIVDSTQEREGMTNTDTCTDISISRPIKDEVISSETIGHNHNALPARQSNRVKRKPIWLNDYVDLAIVDSSLDQP